MHHTLHDWPDDQCVEIVRHVKKVMKPGWSRLLVNEHVIPDKGEGVSWEARYLDLYMMVKFGARERTEGEWRGLLEGRCGLRVEGGVECVVEG